MDWTSERKKLQVKEDRGHFAVATSVLAAFGVATAVLLDAWHPRTGVMIDLRFVGILLFIIFGGFGVYLTWAVAMRWPPFNPRRRDEGQYGNVKKLYLDGLTLQREWGEQTVYYRTLQEGGQATDATLNRRDLEFIERTKKIIAWRDRADQDVVNWFGEKACRTFITEPEVSLIPPDWQRGDQWFINWDQIAGRLAWLRRWLLEQDDL